MLKGEFALTKDGHLQIGKESIALDQIEKLQVSRRSLRRMLGWIGGIGGGGVFILGTVGLISRLADQDAILRGLGNSSC